MTVEATTAAPNSLVLVQALTGGQPPDSLDGLAGSTSTCVAVGTLSSQDGETTIVVTDDAAPVLAANELQVFDGEIDVPGGTLAVTTVFNDVLVTLPVRTGSVALRIWVNHETEPDRIVIAAGSPDGMSRLT